jgi:uncharacterized coiled-coil DUF342 family protein
VGRGGTNRPDARYAWGWGRRRDGRPGHHENIPPEKLEEIKSRFTPDLFISLSDTIKQLRNGLDDISRIGDATVATDEFQKKIKDATLKVDKLSANYGTTADTMAQFSASMAKVKTAQESISKDILTYHQQIQTITKNYLL